MASAMQVPTVFTAVDKFSSVVKGMTSGVDKFSQSTTASIERFNNKANKAAGNMAVAGTAITGAFGLAVNSASTFEKSMSNVSTLIDTNIENMDDMNKEVLALSKTLPVPIDELTSSLYDIRSAGITAENAMAALETSGKLAKAGLSTTGEATNILTSAMNAFASEGMTSDEIANILFKTVKAGKTNMAELSQAFGANASTIQSAGVKLADFQAATAALTTTGQPASQAQNKLKASIVALQKPTAEMAKIYARLGVASEKELIKKEGSLVGAFEAVNKAGTDMGINLAKAWSSSEAAGAVTALLGANNEAYVSTLKDMQSGTDALTGAFEKQLDTTASKTQLAKNNMERLSITIGTQVAPVLSKLIDFFVPLITKITEWISVNPKLTKGIAMFGIALLGLSFITSSAIAIQTAFAEVTWSTVAPILAVVAAIAAIIAVFYYWDEIVAWFSKQWGVFIEWISSSWSKLTDFFSEFDFMNFFKGIGQSIINFLISPLTTVLELISKIPGGIGGSAQKALDSIKGMTDLGVNNEVLTSPEEVQSDNMNKIGLNGSVNLNIKDKGNNVESADANFGEGIMPKITTTQGNF